MADRFPLVVIPEANQIQEIASTLGVTDNLRLNGGLKLIGSASNSSDIELSGGNDGETKITISGASSNVSTITILGKGGNVNNTNIAKFEMNGTNPIVKSFGSFEGNGIIPLGGIIMWAGTGTATAVPTGFTLCDGNGGTAVNGITIPDLTDKFILGANSVTGDADNYPGVSMNQTGGSASSTASHTHGYAFASVDTSTIGNDFQSSGISNVTNHGDINELSQSGSDDGADLAGFTAETQEVGVNQAGGDSNSQTGCDANLPPYFALAYIMRTS